MGIIFNESDFEDVYDASTEKSEKKDGNKISLISSYLYAFGNDVRFLHLYTIGNEFLPYHEKLNELYDIAFEAYDMCAEHAIVLGEKLVNPANVLEECDDWKPLNLDKDGFTLTRICDEVIERGNKVLDIIKNIAQYESFIQSDVDEVTSKLDKIINYVFKQTSDEA